MNTTTASKDLPTLDEITITGNKFLFKSDQILQKEGIRLAHRDSHPGISIMERLLSSHFFFHNMHSKVTEFANVCADCKTFVDKKTMEALRFNQVPSKNWKIVAVDLFDLMPSSNHIIVFQDLNYRYPAAKLVLSTKAENIPAIKEICNNYGRPKVEISDNGPPFN